MNSQIHFPHGVKSKTVHFFRSFDDHTCDAKSLTLNIEDLCSDFIKNDRQT